MIYAFISNLTGEFNIKHLAMDALEKVSVRTFPDKLNFTLPEQVELEQMFATFSPALAASQGERS